MGEENNKKDDDRKDNEDIKSLKKDLDELKTSFKGNQDAIKEISEYVGNMAKAFEETRDKKRTTKEKKEDADDDIPRDLELMDRKKFMDVIVRKVGKIIEDQVKNVGEEVKGVRNTTEQDRLRREYEEVRSKHKDFDDWKPEMKKLFQENPYIKMKQAYILARAQDPTKAEELDKKYKEKEKKEDHEDTPKSRRYGGMAPSSAVVEDTKKENLKGMDAAEKAWQLVMGDIKDLE